MSKVMKFEISNPCLCKCCVTRLFYIIVTGSSFGVCKDAACLTDTYEIEFDFCIKAYEAVGQSLHYAFITGKKPEIVLILDSKYKRQQMVYYERVK